MAKLAYSAFVEEKNQERKVANLTKVKARKILRDGSVRGKKLTAKQKRFFGARASGVRRKRGK